MPSENENARHDQNGTDVETISDMAETVDGTTTADLATIVITGETEDGMNVVQTTENSGELKNMTRGAICTAVVRATSSGWRAADFEN